MFSQGCVRRRLSILTAALAIISSPAYADGLFGQRRCACPPVVCPPCQTPSLQAAPESEMVEPQPAEPGAEEPAPPQPEADQTNQALNDALLGQYDVASTSNFFAPNMLGDQFGNAGSVIVYQPSPISLTLQNGHIPFNFSTSPDGVAVSPGTLTLGTSTGQSQSATLNQPTFLTAQSVTGSPPYNYSYILNENGIMTAIVAANAGALTGTEGTLSFGNGVASYNYNYPDAPISSFNYNYSYLPVRVAVSVVNPSDGGVVGRTKISDDNNPMPRDRFIFNYDYFNNVPLTLDGYNVHRFSPGFEKTFFTGMTSVEVRFPFASTLDSNMQQAIQSRSTEFGDIAIKLKGLVFTNPYLSVAGGLGISLPTASDVNVKLANGRDFVRINNESVTLTPYIAALWTPTARVFSQVWLQYAFDANGNPVLLDSTGSGLASVGRLTSQTLMQLDGQIGYWLIRRPGATGMQLAGLAPFIELHYNTTLNNADAVYSNGVLIGGLGGRFDELNLSAGATAQFGRNLNLSLGAIVPLRTNYDRFFDYQIGFRSNYFFGYTARERSLAAAAASF